MPNPDEASSIKKDVAELETYLRVAFKALGWPHPVESEPDIGYIYIGPRERWGGYSFEIHVTTRIKKTETLAPGPRRTYKLTQYEECLDPDIGQDVKDYDLTAWPCDTLDGIVEKTITALAMEIVGPAVAHLSEDLPF